jgi:multidrug efflux pump subunit AcrA (membrane-fusion protein)
VIGATIVVVLVVVGGVTALAASGSGDSGYRMAKVVRASVGSSMTVVGTVEPVADASASFQVSGQVATVTAGVGNQVTAGESLGTLDTTSLSESVSSAESSLQSDEAKLTEDEDAEASSGTATTTTTTPSSGTSTGKAGSGTGSGSGSSDISRDQATLVADQATSSTEQQQEAADLVQADSTCGISSPTTSTSSGHPPGGGPATSTTTTTTHSPTTTTTTTAPTSTNSTACATALALVATDERSVANDQQQVAADETALSKALATQASSSSSSSSSSGSGTGGTTTSTPSTTVSSAAAATGRSGVSGGSNSDSPTQIASDEAAIDSAEANVVVAEQSLAEGQLTSPINGTIVSVGITVGDTVSADSSTDVVVIIGTNAFQATTTLTSAQVPSVKVGSPAAVSVDGTSGSITGSVSQVGPVQSSDSGYSYPVVVALPSSANKLFSGSSANISIVTGQKKDVVAVPTSAVTTTGTRSSVEVLSSGTPVTKVIKVGIVGSIYTQIISGLNVGQSVVLADYAEPVPASNTATVGGFGGGGFTGGGGGFGGGGTGRFSGGAVGATSLGG